MGIASLARWLEALPARAVELRAGERTALLLGFAYFFCLLCSYYLLRPLRDAMGLAGGPDQLQWLFSATFVVMLLLTPVFGALVRTLPPARFVAVIYRFSAPTSCSSRCSSPRASGRWRWHGCSSSG